MGKEIEMTSIISRCNICGQFFDSKKKLRKHKDKDHRISDSKMVKSAVILQKITNQTVSVKGNYQEEIGLLIE